MLDKKTGNIENVLVRRRPEEFVKDIDRKTGKLVERVELTMNKETLICLILAPHAQDPKTGLSYDDVLDFCGYLKPVEQKVDPRTTAPATPARTISPGWSGRRKWPESSAPAILTGERKWSVDMDVPGFCAF